MLEHRARRQEQPLSTELGVQSGRIPEHSQVSFQNKQIKMTDADYTHLGKLQALSGYFTNEGSLK